MPADEPTQRPKSSRARVVLWAVTWPVLITYVGLLASAGAVSSPFATLEPGSARTVGPLIQVPDELAHDDPGDIIYLTVSVRRATFAYAVRGWLDEEIDVVPRDVVYGGQTREESKRENLQLMDQSKLTAAAVALEHLGFPVEVQAEGAEVLQVQEGSPAATRLEEGDVIVGIDGTPVDLPQDLTGPVASHQPGDQVSLEVRRDGEVRTVDVVLAPRPEDSSRPMIGVVIQPKDLTYDLPFEIEVSTGDVGGPSAGLAFTLAIIDRLTPGSLTGGQRVAVTGEITPDGGVAEVGGVAQKAAAAEREGAVVMLVPAAEVEEARLHAGDLEVVGVEDLDDALAALADLGGNAEDLGRPGEGYTG